MNEKEIEERNSSIFKSVFGVAVFWVLLLASVSLSTFNGSKEHYVIVFGVAVFCFIAGQVKL